MDPAHDEGGFTLIEFMIAAAIMTAVLGGTVVLAMQLQQVYSTQLDDTTVEEEARFTLDWIAQALRNAGTNPYDISIWLCPTTTTFQAIRIDPDADTLNDDVRIQADINPPNGMLGGASPGCTEANEDITIAHDAVAKVITRQDNNTEDAPVTMTEPIFTRQDGAPALLFTYLDSSRNVTTDPDLITYVHVRLTGQSQARNPVTNEYTESTLETEVRLRTR